MLDLSILKSIDFKSSDNLLFFSIVLFLVIIILLVFFFLVAEIIRFIKRVFGIKDKEKKFEKEEQKSVEVSKHKLVEDGFGGGITVPDKNRKEVDANIKTDEQSVAPVKNIAQNFSASVIQDIHNQESKFGVVKNQNDIPNDIPKEEAPLSVLEKPDFLKKEEQVSPINISKARASQSGGGTIMFGNKDEISRTNLRNRLGSDAKMWEAERDVGLNLSATERAHLEKEVFSSGLGENISRRDLKLGIQKLNMKLLGSKNIGEKAKIRKEIKFFKKIGGT